MLRFLVVLIVGAFASNDAAVALNTFDSVYIGSTKITRRDDSRFKCGIDTDHAQWVIKDNTYRTTLLGDAPITILLSRSTLMEPSTAKRP